MQTQEPKKKRSEEFEDTSVAPIHLIPKIDFVPHTVFLLCGPTFSGKSTFADDLGYLAEDSILSFKLLSSDAIRKSLLKESNVSPLASFGPLSRYSDGMSAVSKAAFEILMTTYKAAISYPVSTEIVVVDTTGMSEVFRNEVKKLASEAGYKTTLVTFEYKYRSDYLPEDSDLPFYAKSIIQNSALRFRTKVLPSLIARDFDARIRIKSRFNFGWDVPKTSDWWDDSSIEVWVENALSDKAKEKQELKLSCEGLDYPLKAEGGPLKDPGSPTYIVIGDSHECTVELGKLIELGKTRFPNAIFVHIGDYLDKGGDTENMINFMFDRLGKGDIIVQGNHEAYVVRKLREGGVTGVSAEDEAKWFSSLATLTQVGEKWEGLRTKLFTIYDASKPFAILCDFDINGGLPVIVTHAPCENKYLGKVHDDALRAQRNYRIRDRTVGWNKELAWLYKEADMSHPLHIFGHVSHEVTDGFKGYKYKNKIFLDSGAVHGKGLSAVVVTGGRVVDFLSVPTIERYPSELQQNLGHGSKEVKPFNIHDYDLEFRDLRLLDQVMDKGVKYISGTMSPAPSQGDVLEPLEAGLEWFKKLGVKAVILEPKYMGSRCQMYFFKDDPAKTFATSRAGWVIKGVHGKTKEEYDAFLVSVWKEHEALIQEAGELILDGELLPWYALGSGLIEGAFQPYRDLIKEGLDILQDDAGFQALTEFQGKFNLKEKQGHLVKFEEALARYGQPGEATFKAFNILWKKEGAVSKSHWDKFITVNSDAPALVNFEFPDYLEKAKVYFDNLTVKDGLEGVVAKPLMEEGCDLPYLKIRSPEYLRLVYGYDYLDPKRYARLVRQKNISGKVRLSIAEHEAAVKMLTSEGDAKKELVVKLIGQMKQEKTLDPRL